MLSFADTLTTITGYLIAGLAAAELARNWWQERDRYRGELLANLGILAIVLLGQRELHTGAMAPLPNAGATFLLLLQPVLLLRLVRHFHPVAGRIWIATMAIAVAGTVLSFAMPPRFSDAWHLVLCGYFAVALSAIATRFDRGAGIASGASAMRLRSAAVGSWLNAGIAAAFAIAIVVPEAAPLAAILRKVLGLAMFGAYAVAFAGPQRLTTLWTHRELYRYLRVMSERTPDERARETPGDLARATRQSVPCAEAAVLLFDEEDAATLVSFTAGPSPLRGLAVPFGDGLVTHAIRRGVTLTGTPADCEPSLCDVVAKSGGAITIVPIVSAAHAWGALVMVQRVGSLFPNEEQRTLTELCRHAATSLSNTRLVTMELDRLRRDATALRHVRETPKPIAPATPASPFTEVEVRLSVLAVEDEEGVRDYLRALLSREGYRVTLACGHDDALARAAETPFDLVVTDVNMPDGSGPDLVKALRRRQPYLPAVFISGLSREEFAEMAPGEERNFLQKPFDGARLIGRIEALLQR